MFSGKHSPSFPSTFHGFEIIARVHAARITCIPYYLHLQQSFFLWAPIEIPSCHRRDCQKFNSQSTKVRNAHVQWDSPWYPGEPEWIYNCMIVIYIQNYNLIKLELLINFYISFFLFYTSNSQFFFRIQTNNKKNYEFQHQKSTKLDLLILNWIC